MPFFYFYAMPWDDDNYPDAMKNLSPTQRKEAIEVANALLEDGYNERRAIDIGIQRVRVPSLF